MSMNNVTISTAALDTPNTTLLPQTATCFHIMDEANMTPHFKVTYITILAISFIFITVVNTFLVIGLKRAYTNLTLSKKLFLYLSASDLVTGIVTIPYQGVMVIYGSSASCFQVQLQSFTNTFSPGLSMFTILTISIARYISVIKPTFFKSHANSSWVSVYMFGQIVLAASAAVWYATATTRVHLGSYLVFVTGVCFVVIGGAIILNVFLFIKLRSSHDSTKKDYQKEVIKTLIIISVILFICFLPNGVVFALVGYYIMADIDNMELYTKLIPWVYVPILLNAGLNSCVYIWRDKKINRYLRKSIHNEQRRLSNKFNPLSSPLPITNKRLEAILSDHANRDSSYESYEHSEV
ncbi:sphingosine 1-phosphate receptor 2-like isoform X2 [Clytia hemisphaerica]|uniref:sphingosine 1-phosphate receptor 2-like isoform X2 n=1 Tax=Clytia hemisphaerica TaxID=252671 RepID=UPI0034D6D53B|eukprot:TCONS_00002598-protein